MNNLELFSPLEAKIIRQLKERKTPISLVRLAEKIYGSNMMTKDQLRLIPTCANNTVGTAVRRINAKSDRHTLPWFINGAGMGRNGRKVWIDKR